MRASAMPESHRRYSAQRKGDGRIRHPSPPVFAKDRVGGLGVLEIDRAGLAALVVLELVGQTLLLLERVHSGGLDGRHVDEGIIAPGFVGDEAVTLGVVEKLHCADWHINFLHWIRRPKWLRDAARSERRK